MTRPGPYLTKSRYVDGIRCPKKLWLDVHPGSSHPSPDPYSVMDVGRRVGELAQELFPGGERVAGEAWEHEKALEDTRTRMLAGASALFEAAFEFQGIRIRVDVLERLGNGWGLREVKSTTSVDEQKFHFDDVAVQLYVLLGTGLDVTSVELIHVNNQYVHAGGEIDCSSMLVRKDLTEEAQHRQTGVRQRLPELFSVVQADAEPEVRASKNRCMKPYRCGYVDSCMKDHPDDWVGLLHRISAKRVDEWFEEGVESISQLTSDHKLSESQERIVEVLKTGKPWISEGLGSALVQLGPPAYFLDFETTLPGIPVFADSRPFETIPFQWSLHRVAADWTLSHEEYLADASRGDPRREFAESLIEAVADEALPVVVYSQQYESKVLRALGERFPDLEPALATIVNKMVDLLAVVQEHVFHPGFIGMGSLDAGTYSIKNVLPALVPGLSYASLPGVANGMEASRVFNAIAAGAYAGVDAERYRVELREYCKLDTRAMVEVTRSLQRIAADE